MSRNNTGNSIGSKAYADFEDNIRNLDEAVNSEAGEWKDRFGRPRLPLMEQERRFVTDQSRRESEFQSDQSSRAARFNDFIASSGYRGTGPDGAVEDYSPGITLTEYNQIVRDENGEFWRLSGRVELPYVATGGGLPEDDAFVPVGDAVLRQQLAAGPGSQMVKHRAATVEKAIDRASIATGSNLLMKMMDLVHIRGMYIRNINSTTIGVGIGMTKSTNSVVEYRFRRNADGVLLLRGAYSGVEDALSIRPDITLEGVFNQNNPPTIYTTEVGAKFRATFTGNCLYFSSRVDDRGGMWKVTLSNGLSRNISTYSPTALLRHERLVFDKLDHSTYTVEFEFLGADPMNPPSETARGWLDYRTDLSIRPLRVQEVGMIDLSTAKAVLSPNSIPDFAISARPAGSSYGVVWVPLHGSTNNVSLDVRLRLLADGVEVLNEAGWNVPAEWDFRPIESFVLTQRFEGNNPNGGADGKMWRHYVTHSLGADGILKIQNRLTMTKDVQIASAYFGMLAAESSNVYRLAMSDGYELSPIPTDGSDYRRPIGPTSGMYVGEYAPGNWHAGACYVPSLYDTSSQGGDLQRNPATSIRMNHRADNVTKVYWDGVEPGILPSGHVLRSEHWLAVVSGIRWPNERLGSV